MLRLSQQYDPTVWLTDTLQHYTWTDQQSYTTSGPVSTWMGDRLLLSLLADATSVPAVRSVSLADGHFTALYLDRSTELHYSGPG